MKHFFSKATVLAFIALLGCQGSGEKSASTGTSSPPSRAARPLESSGPALSSSTHSSEPIDSRAAFVRRGEALELLRQASEAQWPLLRAHAVEAMLEAPDEARSIVIKLLRDENRGVRFAAAIAAGRLSMNDALPLLRPMLSDESHSVRAAAIYAMHRCGQNVDQSILASMLLSTDPELRANAALVLGELGNPSAIPMLRESMSTPIPRLSAARRRIIELQVAEALVRLGEEKQIELIRAALFSPPEFAELIPLACQISGRLHDEAYLDALGEVAMSGNKPPEARLSAVAALAQLRPGLAPVSIAMQYVGATQVEVRAQSAHTLGWFPDAAVHDVLGRMMQDSEPLVQVAAAGAIVRMTSPARLAQR